MNHLPSAFIAYLLAGTPLVAQTRAEFDDLRQRVAQLEQKIGSAAQGVDPHSKIVKLNGGLEAQVLSVGRSKDRSHLTVQLHLRNTGKAAAELLLLTPDVGATDNMGGVYRGETVKGVATCNQGATYGIASRCLGIPDDGVKIALQAFTRLDPNPDPSAGINVNFSLVGEGQGPYVSFSANMFFRFTDPDRDATKTDQEIYKQFRLVTLSCPSQLVIEAK